MSETEVGYWQAIVDDQRVAAERKDEALAEARAEIVRLREIIAAGAKFLALANRVTLKRIPFEETDAIVEEVVNDGREYLLEPDTRKALRQFSDLLTDYLDSKMP
jgi:hypothetical protein